jgi:hypothetical protein
MMILHDAAGPAVLAVNLLSPSSLLSSWGRPDRSRACSPGPGALARALGALIAPRLARAACIRKPASQDPRVDDRPRMTVYIRARSGGQPKGARCLP